MSDPRIGDEVTLDELELNRTHKLVEDLEASARRRGLPRLNYDFSNAMRRNDLDGYAAKFAFAKLFGEEYNPVIGPDGRIEHGESDYDLIMNGYTVKVSNTKHLNGVLLGHPHVTSYADYFVLMVGTGNKFIFKGFLSSEELITGKRYVAAFADTDKPAYVAKQLELLPALPL